MTISWLTRLPQWWRDLPWRVKLVVVLVTLAITPVLAIAGYNYGVMRGKLLQAAREQNLQRARGTAQVIDGYLTGVLDDVRLVAVSAPVVAIASAGPPSAAMRQSAEMVLRQMRDTHGFDALFVANQIGEVAASTDPRVDIPRLTSMRYFLTAVAGETSVDDPRFEPDHRGIFLHVSAPVRKSSGAITGAAIGRVTMKAIDRLIAGDLSFASRSEFGLLWDSRGIRLSTPTRPELTFRPLAPLPPASRGQLIAERRFGPDTEQFVDEPSQSPSLVETGRWLLHDRNSNPYLRLPRTAASGYLQVALVPVRTKRWVYGIFAPESAILASLHEETNRTVWGALIIGLLAILLAVMTADWVSKPLRTMGQTANAIAAGDMGRRVKLRQRDEVGQLAAAFDAMTDILATKEAQLRGYADGLERMVEERTSALRASEAELRGLLSAIPDLMLRLHRDGRVLNFGSSREDDLLVAPGEFVGKRLDDVMPASVAARTVSAIEAAIKTGEVQHFEYDLTVQKDLRHFEARVVVTGADEVLAIVRNVTARKRAEERVQFLARASAVLASSLDYERTLQTVSELVVPFLADGCEVTVREGSGTRHVAVAASSPDKRMLMREMYARYPSPRRGPYPLARVLRTGEPELVTELTDETVREFAQDEEHLRYLRALAPRSMMLVPLVARGHVFGAITFAILQPGRRYRAADLELAKEVAHRAAIAIDNARLYRELQDLNRMKDEFLSTVSHELRTPLNAVLGWARLLKTQRLPDEQARRAIDTIERNARIQAQLIDDLLDVSRIITGKLPLDVRSVNLGAVVEAAVDAVRPAADAKGLRLEVSLDPSAASALGDANRLQQIVWNLLANAIKFTPERGRVVVRLQRQDGDVEIEVSDTGVGIDPAFLPYVFDRFRQADSTTTRVHGGLGLGLAIVRHLAELHGGVVRASSKGEGQGATFTVRLPVRPDAVRPGLEFRANRPDETTAPVLLNGVDVLVVDDEPDARELICAMLRGLGATVRVARSAVEGMAALRDRTPDVLVADIAMPEEDGYSLIRQIRADSERRIAAVPALALTAHAGDSNRTRAIEAGFQLHLPKPVDPAELGLALARLLGREANELSRENA